MENLIKFECLQAVSVYVFLLLMSLASFKLLFKADSEERVLQKIIGGLAVFVVAIISKNSWVFTVSLFIGGLIIASEEFMEKLAIIFKGDSEHIGQNLKTGPASKSEIDKKQLEENKDVSDCMSNGDDKKDVCSENFEKIKKMENDVLKFLSEEYGIYFKPQVKIETNKGFLIADGVIYDSPSNNIISKIVEIKYVKFKRAKNLIDLYIKKTLDSVGFLRIDTPILFILVSEDIDRGELIKISEMLKERHLKNIELRAIEVSSDGNFNVIY